MMLMNIVTVASIDDEEKSKPTRERERKKRKKKKKPKPEPPSMTFFFSFSRARAFSLSLIRFCFSESFFFLTFCMTKKTPLARQTIVLDDDDDDDSFQNVAKSDFRKKKRISTRLKSSKDYQ